MVAEQPEAYSNALNKYADKIIELEDLEDSGEAEEIFRDIINLKNTLTDPETDEYVLRAEKYDFNTRNPEQKKNWIEVGAEMYSELLGKEVIQVEDIDATVFGHYRNALKQLDRRAEEIAEEFRN